MQQQTFDKISNFVRDRLSDSSDVVIRPRESGFKINHYIVNQSGDRWILKTQLGTEIYQFFSRKYAVLSAVCLSKNRGEDFAQVHYLDKQLDIATRDQYLYERLLRDCKDEMRENVYLARLSKAKQMLETIRNEIRHLEKTLQLQ